MSANKFFIEVDCVQRSEHSRGVSGDVYLQKRYGERIIQVLSDGEGSGIRANVVASVIASMAIGYTHAGEEPLRAAQALVKTFARGEHLLHVKQATFTTVDIDAEGHVRIVEFENPPVIIFREGKIFTPERKEVSFKVSEDIELQLYITEFDAKEGDRVVLYTDGVELSGFGTRRLPEGFNREGVVSLASDILRSHADISAREMCAKIIAAAEMNDLFVVKNDTSCASVYFRQPRKILICTGPPFDAGKDKYLTDKVLNYDGETIVCGGTTSQIISRESGREVTVELRRDSSGLPPTAKMEGVTLITEGVLTLGKVKVLLETLKNSEVTGRGIDAKVVRMLLEHDVIEFIVGTRINSIHQDPSLPVELELRRNIIKDIARLLESKFVKNVNIQYL